MQHVGPPSRLAAASWMSHTFPSAARLLMWYLPRTHTADCMRCHSMFLTMLDSRLGMVIWVLFKPHIFHIRNRTQMVRVSRFTFRQFCLVFRRIGNNAARTQQILFEVLKFILFCCKAFLLTEATDPVRYGKLCSMKFVKVPMVVTYFCEFEARMTPEVPGQKREGVLTTLLLCIVISDVVWKSLPPIHFTLFRTLLVGGFA